MDLPHAPRTGNALLFAACCALLAVSAGLLAAVVLLRGEMVPGFHDISNYTQLLASAGAAGAAAWAYTRRTPAMLLVHGAFAGAAWTLGNMFWYAFSVLVGYNLMYPTVADLGFAGVFLFLIAGYEETSPRNSLPAWLAAPIMLPFLVVPFWMIAAAGLSFATGMTLTLFVLAAGLVAEAVLRSLYRHRVLFLATLGISATHMLYGVRSVLPDPPWFLLVVGPLAAVSFSLFALGYLGYEKEAPA